MAQRKSATGKGRPGSKTTAKRPASRGSGSRVSGSANLHVHILSGLFSNFSLFRSGGGGRGRGRGRRGGGLISRLAKSAAKTFGEARGKDSGQGKGKSAGRSGTGQGSRSGRSFDEFKEDRPDLFEEEQIPDGDDTSGSDDEHGVGDQSGDTR